LFLKEPYSNVRLFFLFNIETPSSVDGGVFVFIQLN